MYFQIENTPEHIRRARRTEAAPKESPKEECPRLILAPFSRPPQVVFDNVLIGATCERNLEVFNPSKQVQQITLGKSLPPGLVIQLPGEWLLLEPETCYCVTLMWTPTQPTAMRETIRFTNENRGRYDVIVVLKSVLNIKGKGAQPKGFKISPGKIKKKVGKKSPVAVYKKKSEIIYNTTQIKKTYSVIQSQQKYSQVSNKENYSINDYSMDSRPDKCPFDSPSSVDFNFDTTEVFSNMRRPEVLQQTYDKSYTSNNRLNVPNNVLKPSNKQKCDVSATELFDNLTFTPLKTQPNKADKLNKGPQIILSMNSESDFDDSLDLKNGGNKENQTHSIISITATQPPNKWLTVNHHAQLDNHIETPTVLAKKHPNTSSPKELNSPNFSINTEFSRISDLSFFPQRFSTERKCFPKFNNDTHEIFDDPIKLSSDTYTKDSPNTPVEPNFNHLHEMRPPHFFMKDQPKMCRQALFKEYQFQKEAFEQKNYLSPYEHNVWQNDLRVDTRSPPRSITPPLQSIPEESVQLCDTQVLDRTDKHKNTFTINRTFDKTSDHFTTAHTNNRQSWSKKAIRAEPDLWKIPITHVKKTMKSKQSAKNKDSIGGKISNTTFEANKSNVQNMTVNQIGNVYSQSSTVDPFVSSTYFYDEEAVEKFETEFKRWLNCILTPPADLESNIEQKVDVGKAWIENRNKDVPVAPTKEQVSSAYHNSHRLESLRRSARALLMSPEIAQVFQKLTLQIEKKLIAIRTDRNLHLDVGLQKVIMELLLSYNPLWLRIGLEAIYGLVLPLKSNSDIEGLTTFIIQRMFKNPFLRNKHSKSNAPNMLLPAYMEAIKKFTLKKFFMLVYFLDQAKQRKLISHDPCLFCRNAVCKESREIIIRFTRELIAGIGDITKHLRPLGYVVCHKQSYLDEYKYAVHNIALDIRDGVRLVKVMEIILMKDGLLSQLRTPAISRLQKIHNVQVAMNALKEANFVIHGDITATDIADGHREKTLSLLWQLIHVFRAPLFEKAANVIQTWWRKKYEVIVEKKKEAERILQKQNNAASLIQCWWRRIQYNRLVEWKMQQITTATIIVQKYCRMWTCRTRLVKWKKSVLKIEEWYRGVRLMREAKLTLQQLKLEREELRYRAATKLQTYVRRWLCMKQYEIKLKKIVLIQSLVRRFLAKKEYEKFRQAVVCVQRRYRGKLAMEKDMQIYKKQRLSAIVIQSFYRMIVQRRQFLKLRKSVKIIEERYSALLRMRNERRTYLDLRRKVIKIQTLFRRYSCVDKYLRQRELIISLQRRIRAHQLMKKEKEHFLKFKNAAVVLQKYVKSYLIMKKVRQEYLKIRQSTIIIQRHFRSHLLAKAQRKEYIMMKNATIILQRTYRSVLLSRKERSSFLNLKKSAVVLQRRYRAQITMRLCREEYTNLRKATIAIQRRYRALIEMRKQRSEFLKLKTSCRTIQNAYRAVVLGRQKRQEFLQHKQAAIKIQNWLRSCKKGKIVKQEYQQSKQACVTIQRVYRAYIIGRKQRQEFVRIRTATITIQKYYRAYIEMKIVRQQFIKLKTATVVIQKYYKSYVETKKQRKSYLEIKNAAVLIGDYYKRYRETKMIRENFYRLRQASLYVQRKYRSICAMRAERERYLKARKSIVLLQQKYKALLAMRRDRQSYLQLRQATVTIQTRYRAYRLMKYTRVEYIIKLRACRSIQRFYRAYVTGTKQREEYIKLKQSAIVLQRRYKALIAMRMERKSYLEVKKAAVNIQRRYRARRLMLQQRKTYINIVKSCIILQRAFRAYVNGKRQRLEYVTMKSAIILIQRRYRLLRETRKIQNDYQQLRNSVILVQRRYRANKISRFIRHNEAAKKIQNWYIATRKRDECRQQFLTIKKSVTVVQSIVRMRIARKHFITIRKAAICIQMYYRYHKLTTIQRQRYVQTRLSIIKLQSHVRGFIARKRFHKLRSAVVTIQAAYRLKKRREIMIQRRNSAAICLQKYVRRYIVRSRYLEIQQKVLYIQRLWRGKLVTRLTRCEFLQKRRFIVKFQSIIRGYLVRKHIQAKREELQKVKEEQRRYWAASKIQALCRGHIARVNIAHDKRVAELRRRWRDGGLKSSQESMKERNEEAMEVLRNISGIETVIKAFRSLELLTEVFPMLYNDNASAIVHRVYTYMSVTNRSISSIEVLKSAAAVLVNLTRYRVTGPKIYLRDRIPPILKFMWRFSNSETQLFCIMSTYLWLFSKYDNVRKDLTELLNMPENHRMLVTIKGNVDRTKRMTTNIMKNKFHTPQPSKFISHTGNQSLNMSVCSMGNSSIILPALEPDYGIVRVDKPRYFEDAQQAINCLFHTYNL
ncbi:microtubule assembly factor abnormal spindle [Anticarsia gemmatalis]|uniref:microtubule assembly factor abnormal spindle n=1 Tax=Anticarsia gemmatalis TaxID=129554 RepID=UPI003F7631FD